MALERQQELHGVEGERTRGQQPDFTLNAFSWDLVSFFFQSLVKNQTNKVVVFQKLLCLLFFFQRIYCWALTSNVLSVLPSVWEDVLFASSPFSSFRLFPSLSCFASAASFPFIFFHRLSIDSVALKKTCFLVKKIKCACKKTFQF